MTEKRLFGPDLVRAVACVFVLGVHFYLYSGFYDLPYQGTAMMISVPIRMALMTCVPLFMMLTGYLCVHKKWSGAYYRGAVPILLSYFICGVVCVVFMHFNEGIPAGPLSIARRLLDFTAVPYGWYVEMYVGLFLIIPFVNAAWNALPKGGKKAAVISVVVMSILPNVTNFTYQIFPDFWISTYPLAFYLAGAWLREYPLKIRRGWLILGWLGLSLAVCPLQYKLFREMPFDFSPTNYYYSLFVFGSTFCLFAALVGIEGERLPRPLKWCVRRIAKLSFSIYMLSYIGDALIYPILNSRISDFGDKLIWHVPVLVLNLVFSAVLAQIVEWLCGFIKIYVFRFLDYTANKRKKSSEA